MPVDILEKSIKSLRPTCLIIAPFDSAGSRIKDTIQRALDELGIRTLSLDNLSPGAALVNAVTDAIQVSDFIVADVSRQNPNVMYELGYAHALRKPTILIMSSEGNSSLPNHLQGFLYITYDANNLRDLRNKLMHSAKRYTVSGGGKMTSTCFVVMPFRPELNFLYLYLQGYLQEKHGLHVERGDHRILTKPLLEKIRDQILAADVIIGDITGRNPNVFYELGLADAYGKPVILMTQDPPTEAPADVRHLEYIVYDMAKHDELLKKIDNAIQNVFMDRYRIFYEHACDLLKSFNSDNHSSYARTTLEEFQARVMQGERTQGLPNEKEDYGYAAFLLPKILLQTTDIEIMRRVTDWLELKFTNAR